MSEYGFVYIWFDIKRKRFYIGCHWGREDDGYICSSTWMNHNYKKHPEYFKRRILKTNISNKKLLLEEEYRYLSMIKKEELGKRYYNKHNHHFNHWSTDPDKLLTTREKLSKNQIGKHKKGEKRPSEVGAKISATKKGVALTEEHKLALKKPKVKFSEERRQRQKEIVTKQWASGQRKRKEPKQILPHEDLCQLRSDNIKSRWADPVWKAKQQAKLREAWEKKRG